MSLNPTNSNLAENEQKILHAGKLPYENFRVRDFPIPLLLPPYLPLQPSYLVLLGLNSVSTSFFWGGEEKI